MFPDSTTGLDTFQSPPASYRFRRITDKDVIGLCPRLKCQRHRRAACFGRMGKNIVPAARNDHGTSLAPAQRDDYARSDDHCHAR